MKRQAFGVLLGLVVPGLAHTSPLGQAGRLAPITPVTLEFANQAARGDIFEIEAGKIAQAKAANAGVREFAARMVVAHSQTMEELNALAGTGSRLRLDLPGALDEDHTTQLAELKAASGPAFDRLYLKQQIVAHEAAAAFFGNYAQDGQDEPLKNFARRTVPVLKRHLATAERLWIAARRLE